MPRRCATACLRFAAGELRFTKVRGARPVHFFFTRVISSSSHVSPPSEYCRRQILLFLRDDMLCRLLQIYAASSAFLSYASPAQSLRWRVSLMKRQSHCGVRRRPARGAQCATSPAAFVYDFLAPSRVATRCHTARFSFCRGDGLQALGLRHACFRRVKHCLGVRASVRSLISADALLRSYC